MYTTNQKKQRLDTARRKANPIWTGNSGWLVKAPEGMSRQEVEQTLKIQAAVRCLYMRSLLEILK